MEGWREESFERARNHAARFGGVLIGQLGYGFDGSVFATNRQSAIKALQFERLYLRERDVYLRLQSHGVVDIAGFTVPQLVDFDDELWTIEVGIVTPPFVLDFAGAYLDRRPDFPDDVMEEWNADKAEQFGEERWSIVRSVMSRFAAMGIYLADVKPGNITFAD